MENLNLNKSICEEMFGGDLDMTEVPECGKSEARLNKVSLREKAAKEGKVIQRAAQILEGCGGFLPLQEERVRPH